MKLPQARRFHEEVVDAAMKFVPRNEDPLANLAR
jgi:hypothetical protein